MSRRPRRNHSAAFKAKVALDAVVDGKTIAEIAQKHDVHPNQVSEWRRQLLDRPSACARMGSSPTHRFGPRFGQCGAMFGRGDRDQRVGPRVQRAPAQLGDAVLGDDRVG